MGVENLLPRDTFDMTFKGGLGQMTFRAVEVKESRDLEHGYSIVYDVEPTVFTNILFTDAVYTEAEQLNDMWGSDETVIGWNTWKQAGWTIFDRSLVKKWPPECICVSHNRYRVTIKYAPLFIIDFQITPITVKRYTSFSTQAYVLDGSTYKKFYPAADDKFGYWLINVDKKGKAQGVDVIEPEFTWTERWTWGPVSQLHTKESQTETYLGKLTELAGTINSAPFRGFGVGQVLFRGGVGRYAKPLTWEIDYQFSARRKQEAEQVGDVMLPLMPGYQGGWAELDTSGHETKEIPEAGRTVLRQFPTSVRVHRVHKYSDFGELETLPQVELGVSHILERDDVNEFPTIGTDLGPPMEAG